MSSLVTTTDRPYTNKAGLEPIPGYRVIEPLGRGGFGEVWLCEAPGGLMKAMKFVAPDPDSGSGASLEQEYEAFQSIKAIRHPFLLTLERVELVGDELIMVMELADAHLQDRFVQCQSQGLVGIPRAELLGYLIDAAEALDHIGRKYGLQHLDIKPANLFIISDHAKVGDYGLVCRLSTKGDATPMLNRGLTPRYVAPEVLRGQVHGRSDQYSLALVYAELLTGYFPYTARTAQQMMLAHVSGTPDLSHLPPSDRSSILRALSKNPDERFASCLGFVQSLISVQKTDVVEPSLANKTKVFDTNFVTPGRTRFDRIPTAETGTPVDTLPPGWVAPHNATRTPAQPYGSNPQTLPARPSTELSPLKTVPANAPKSVGPSPLAEDPIDLTVTPEAQFVQLPAIRSVVTVSSLLGFDSPPSTVWADQLIDTVLTAAAGNGRAPKIPGDIGRRADGTWICRFPTTMVPDVVGLKVEPMIDDGWFDAFEAIDKATFVLRKVAPATGMWGRISGKKPSGLEVVLRWPTGHGGCGEVEATGSLFGAPEAAFVRESLDLIPRLISELRHLFRNVEDRRKSPRISATFPVTFYPITDDGLVLASIPGRCRDLSSGGLSAVTGAKPTSRYLFAAFEGCGQAEGTAILVRLLRVQNTGYEYAIAGRYRTDL